MYKPNEGELNNTIDGKEYYGYKDHHSGTFHWAQQNTEDHVNLTNTLSIYRGSTKIDSKKLTITKYFKDGILSTNNQSYIQAFIYQFNVGTYA